jgi:hypothetical protein
MHQFENENGDFVRLLETVQNQAAMSQDFLVPTNQIQVRTTVPATYRQSQAYKGEDNEQVTQIIIERTGGEPTHISTLNTVAFEQLANKSKLDIATARRLQDHYPVIFDDYMNAYATQEPAKRMLRTHSEDPDLTMGYDGYSIGRAWTSDSYKTFDHLDLLEAALPTLRDSDLQHKIISADITERRLYLRTKCLAVTGEAQVGDPMALGLCLSNSEVGLGSVLVRELIWRLACINGMQTQTFSRHAHLTSARGDDDLMKVLSAEAVDADNHAMKLKTRDLVAHIGSRESFEKTLDKMRAANEDTIQGSNVGAVEALGTVLKLSKKDTSKVLDGLIATMGQAGYEGKSVSKGALVNAVTACAHDAHPDRVDEWQQLGGKLLDLPRSEWSRVALAA